MIADRNEDALSGRGAAIGYLIGFTLATTVIAIVGTVGGLGFGPSLGLGAFVGVWGGGGFGFMLGGTLPLAREIERAEHAAPATPASARAVRPTGAPGGFETSTVH